VMWGRSNRPDVLRQVSGERKRPDPTLPSQAMKFVLRSRTVSPTEQLGGLGHVAVAGLHDFLLSPWRA
jgi:hypothetical protein